MTSKYLTAAEAKRITEEHLQSVVGLARDKIDRVIRARPMFYSVTFPSAGWEGLPLKGPDLMALITALQADGYLVKQTPAEDRPCGNPAMVTISWEKA